MAAKKNTDIALEAQNIPEDGSGVQIEKSTAVDAAFGEAVDVYGDIATAEELGYVHRG
jgi:hypothetical protein